MSREEQVEKLTAYMANFIGYTAKVLPDDVIAKLDELAEREVCYAGSGKTICRAFSDFRKCLLCRRFLGLCSCDRYGRWSSAHRFRKCTGNGHADSFDLVSWL